MCLHMYVYHFQYIRTYVCRLYAVHIRTYAHFLVMHTYLRTVCLKLRMYLVMYLRTYICMYVIHVYVAYALGIGC